MAETDDAVTEGQLVQRCRELVDIPSVSRDEAEVESYIRGVLPPSFDTVQDEGGVMFVRPPRRPGHDLIVLAGHTDTVPIENNLPSRVEKGVMFGRGTSDMKGGLAVMIELARWFADDNPTTSHDVGFLFFAREELSAAECPLLPTLHANEELHNAAIAIVMEPTSNAIEAGCQGNVNLKLVFQGQSAHTARPWQGVNAAHKAITALQELAHLQPNEVEIDGLIFKEVVSVTSLTSGIARNVVPPSAEATINVRYAPSRDPQKLQEEWVTRFEKLGATVIVEGLARPAPVVVHHPVVESLLANGAGQPVPKQAWTNAADFAEVGVPAVNFGPGDPLFAHKQDEQIPCSALLTSFRTLQRTLLQRTPSQ